MRWRDVKAGDLGKDQIGERLALAGWAATRRDHGGLSSSTCGTDGLAQLVINPERAPEAATVAHGVRNEFVIRAEGEVAARAPEAVNPNLPTGEVELQVDELEIVSRSEPLPFQLDEENVDEGLRLRYRYLDLRREQMQRNLRLRHGRRSDPPLHGRRRLRRHLDAQHEQGHAGRRARLPRAGAAATRPFLRPDAVAAAVQADA